MKTRLLILVQCLIVLCLGFEVAAAGDLEVLWERTSGGTSNDRATSIEPTGDGGYIVAGYTSSQGAGRSDVYLLKTDWVGNMVWEKTFGGTANEWGWSVQQTSDGGYVITGATSSYGAGFNDAYLIKTDPNGEMQWDNTFGGAGIDEGYSVQQTADGGFIIAGHTSSYGAGYNDVYLAKADPNGDLQWEGTYGGSGVDYGLSVQQTSDGGYIICGVTLSNSEQGYSDAYLIKTDSEGALEWERTFGAASCHDEGGSVRQTSDGGYILTGGVNSDSAGSNSPWNVGLIKTDSEGIAVWEKELGGTEKDYGRSVRQTSDGGYIVVGETLSYGAGNEDVYLIKTNGSGEMDWETTFGGTLRDFGRSVQQTVDGGYTIAGTTYSYGAGACDVYLIRLGEAVPAANAGEDQNVNAGAGGIAQVTLDGSGSINPTGGELSYAWTWTIDDQICDANGVSPAIELPIGEHVIELTVSNEIEASAPDQVVITVGIGPLADAGEDQTVSAGASGTAQVTLDGSGSTDGGSGELTYAWTWTIDDQVYDANGVGPTIELPAGENVINLTVSNGIEDSAPDQVVITVEAIPVADAGEDQIAYIGVGGGTAQATLDGSGSIDPAGGELAYTWTWTIDDQLCDVNGVAPTIELPIGEHAIDLIVSNGIKDSEPDQVVITVLSSIESKMWILTRQVNRRSKRPAIYAWVDLPQGIGKDQIRSDQPLLLYPGGLEATRQQAIQWGAADAPYTRILAAFSKADLMAAVPDNGQVELQVIGQLEDGVSFHATGTIMIKGPQ